MPKLTETIARKTPFASTGTKKHWDTELKGLVLFVGKQSKSWYCQRDVGGQTQRRLIGRYPVITAGAAREAEKFLDYWVAVAGERGLGRDRIATWRNWVRPTLNNPTPSKKGGRDDGRLPAIPGSGQALRGRIRSLRAIARA